MKEIITYNQNNNFTIQYEFSDIEFQILEKIYFAHYNKNFSNNKFGIINSKDLSKNERDYINKFNHPFNQRMLIIDYDKQTIELTFFARQLMFETLSIGYVVKYFEEDGVWQPECHFKNKTIAEAYLKFAEKLDSMNRKIETFRYGKYSTTKFVDEDYSHLKNINDESNNKK